MLETMASTQYHRETSYSKRPLNVAPAQSLKKTDYDENTCSWIVSEVEFPHGTKFRGKYKGYFYSAEVINGCLMMNGRPFSTPSSAALSITRNSDDGWLFWECQLPDQSCWQSIYGLREKTL